MEKNTILFRKDKMGLVTMLGELWSVFAIIRSKGNGYLDDSVSLIKEKEGKIKDGDLQVAQIMEDSLCNKVSVYLIDGDIKYISVTRVSAWDNH